MTPTADLRTELRELIAEEIPAGGTAADTQFADARLDSILTASVGLYAAAAECWRRKAAKLMAKLGDVESYAIGQEQTKRINLSTALNHAQAMVKQFEGMADKTAGKAGATILKIKPPEVL
jgi:hypothetical protein